MPTLARFLLIQRAVMMLAFPILVLLFVASILLDHPQNQTELWKAHNQAIAQHEDKGITSPKHTQIQHYWAPW